MNVIQTATFATGMNPWVRGTMKHMFSEIKDMPVFQDLKKEYWTMVEPLCERFSSGAGSVIVIQGTTAEHLFLILSGKVEIMFNPEDGHPITIAHVGSGGCFGWSAIVGSDTYTSSAIAIEDLEAVRIGGDALRELCREEPEAGRAILEILAESVSGRWSNAHGQVKSILAQGMEKDS